MLAKSKERNNYKFSLKKTDQVDDFKNILFRSKLNSEVKKAYDEIKEQSKKNDYTKLVCIGSSSKHQYNFTIFLVLKTFAESLYNGSLSLKVAKLKQRDMEDRIISLKEEKFKTQKESVFFNAREFYKLRKMILIAFENNVFPLSKQYRLKNISDWEEDERDSTYIFPEETDELLPSVKLEKEKLKKKECLKI